MSSFEGPDESDGDVEEVNKRRKKKANLTCYPGTNPAGLKHPAVPKKKKRNRKEQDVVGKLSGKDIPYVATVVGVTTLSNTHKGHVTAYNKCVVSAAKATTDMARDKQDVQRAEMLRRIRLIEATGLPAASSCYLTRAIPKNEVPKRLQAGRPPSRKKRLREKLAGGSLRALSDSQCLVTPQRTCQTAWWAISPCLVLLMALINYVGA
jgi:hypothetical protein